MRVSILTAIAALLAAAVSPRIEADTVREPRLIGIQFVGRTVSDLDRSVAFYKALGFQQDPLAPGEWRERDEVQEHLYNATGFATRMAKLFVINEASGQRFVVYLREIKGIPRTSFAGHPPWDPGATGLGLVCADAQALWARLKAQGLLHARNRDRELVAPPGSPREWVGFITDPDGLDIDLVQARPAGNARGELLPGVDHVSLVVKDPAKAVSFYSGVLGGQLESADPKWSSGPYSDSSNGGRDAELRMFHARFPEDLSPEKHSITYQLVEYRAPEVEVTPRRITDIGVSYVGFEVHDLAAWVDRAVKAGAKIVSDRPLVTMRGTGVTEVMLQDPDTGAFVLLFETPPAK